VATLFISDLHLDASRPEIGEQFLTFLKQEACDAEALYILGDLFEAWLGDDDPNPYYAAIKVAIRDFAATGVPTYFMHGNRDFMIGEEFAAETGVVILHDPQWIDLHGTTVLLSHGDTLCTDDLQYQQVRAMTRDPEWQAMMRAKSIDERIAFAIQARKDSAARGESLDDVISDVNQDAVLAALREHEVEVLLHGHTHRPGIHDVDLGERMARRIVLGDWFEQGSYVRWSRTGPELIGVRRSPTAAARSESGNSDQAP
jgi:UDP-2,3-diacylglucosamine hydrolase